MKVDRIAPKDGPAAAFFIENVTIGRRGFCRIVEGIPAKIVRRPKFLSWFREEVFCEFDVDGVLFEAEEPYGDNALYWVGPAGTGIDGRVLQYYPQIERVIAAFEAA